MLHTTPPSNCVRRLIPFLENASAEELKVLINVEKRLSREHSRCYNVPSVTKSFMEEIKMFSTTL